MNFSYRSDALKHDPCSSQKSAELKYVLTYLFGDISLDEMELATKLFVDYLDPNMAEDRYVQPILSYIERDFPHLNWEYDKERRIINNNLKDCQVFFRYILECLQNPEIKYTLSLIPPSVCRSALSGRSTVFLNVSINEIIEQNTEW